MILKSFFNNNNYVKRGKVYGGSCKTVNRP